MADARDEIVDKIEEVSKSSKSSKGKGVDESQFVERMEPDKEHFDSLMQNPTNPNLVAQNDNTRTNFMDEVRNLQRKVDGVSKASPDTIMRQAKDVIAQIDDVKEKLKSPDLQLPTSVQTLMKNKLSHIDESLKVALNRSGSEYMASPSQSKIENPVERFLGFLTHSQYQLQKVAQDVENMHLNKQEISPAALLAIQLKVGYVSQEISFFTAALNNALQSVKTLMNVQV